MESIELLEQFLKKRYASEYPKFSTADKQFLATYSIDRKQGNSRDLLKSLGISDSYDAYFCSRSYVRAARDELQYMYERFSRKLNRQSEVSFDDSFPVFWGWWLSEMDNSGLCHCCYCNIDEITTQEAFASGIIRSKKPSFSGALQVERMDPSGGYRPKNCKFACVLCNNAKSDMITRDDFVKYIAPGIARYWQHIKEELGK